jgi:eukaryotic-like serine/threonine-protein kinase
MLTGLLLMQLLSNVAARLADMHEAGFVHRDLKPANVMWLPRENRWTVIDFGCTARIGAPAPLCFTLAYAAPEVVRALEMGTKTIIGTTALDAWSLGVMAFELLTGSPAFRLVTDGRARVCVFLRYSPFFNMTPLSCTASFVYL